MSTEVTRNYVNTPSVRHNFDLAKNELWKWGSENHSVHHLDINQKFQLTQFYFDSQRGFLTKSTFEIIIKKLIRIFQNLWFTSIHFSIEIFSITVGQSKLRFFEISIFCHLLDGNIFSYGFYKSSWLKWIELNKNCRNINSLIMMIFESGFCMKNTPSKWLKINPNVYISIW